MDRSGHCEAVRARRLAGGEQVMGLMGWLDQTSRERLEVLLERRGVLMALDRLVCHFVDLESRSSAEQGY